MPHQPRQRRSFQDVLAGIEASRQSRLRRQQRLLAQLAVDAPLAPRTTTQPSPPIQPEEGGSFVGDVLRGMDPVRQLNRLASAGPLPGIGVSGIPDLFGKTMRGLQAVEKPVAAAALTLPWEKMIPELSLMGVEVGEKEQARRQRSRDILKQAVTGRTGFGEARAGLEAIQRERPGSAQFFSEAITSPLNIIPFGMVAKGVKLGFKGVRAVAPVATHLPWNPLPIEFTPISETIEQIHNPKTAELLKKIPLGTGEWVATKFSRSVLMDPNNPIRTAIPVAHLLNGQRTGMVTQIMREIDAQGNYKKLFDLDDFGVSSTFFVKAKKAGDAPRKASFQEIAQHPEDFILNPEQKHFMDFAKARIQVVEDYAKSIGADMDDALGKVPGDYWPNLWQFMDDYALNVRGRSKKIGGKAFFQNSRLMLEANEAFRAGFRADPMFQFRTYLDSAYKRISDHLLVKHIAPIAATRAQRFGRSEIGDILLGAQGDSLKRLNGVRAVDKFIKDFSIQGPENLILAFRGEKGNLSWAPELVEEITKLENLAGITGLKGIKRRRAYKDLKARSKVMVEEARKQYLSRKEMVRKARLKAGPQTQYGERQYPMSAFGSQIFTPDDAVRYLNPAIDTDGLKGISTDDLHALAKLISGQPEGSAWLGGVNDAASASRSLVASVDGSYALIQALPLLSNPRAYARTLGFFAQGFWDSRAVSAEMTKHWDTMVKLNRANQLDGAEFELMEGFAKGGWLNKALDYTGKAPLVGIAPKALGKTLSKFSEQFTSSNLLAKMYLYEGLEPMAARSFAAGNKNAYIELADSVAKMTGSANTGKLGINPTATQVMGGFLMFAQRYFFSITGFMADSMKGNLRGDVARNVLGKMMAAGTLAYTGAAHRLGQAPQLNPDHRDFMCLVMGNDRVCLGSKYISLARFGTKFLKDAMLNPGKSVNPAAWSDHDSSMGHFLNFVRGQSAIPGSMGWDIATGNTYIGEPTGGMNIVKTVLPSAFIPFWAQAMFDEPTPGASGMVGEMLGARTSPLNQFERGVRLADVVAQEMFGENYHDLENDEMRGKVRKENPDIDRYFDEGNALYAGRGKRVNQFRVAIKKFDENQYLPELNKIIRGFARDANGREFRDILGKIRTGRRMHHDWLANPDTGEYADVIELLDQRRKEMDLTGEYVGDIAYNQYVAEIFGGDFEDPETGEYLFDEWQEARQLLRSSWGEDVWDYVIRRLEYDTHPLLKELYRGRDSEAMQRYFSTGTTILKRSGNDTLLPLWRNYVKAPPDIKKSMEEQDPILKQVARASTIARQSMRDGNAKLEQFVIRWGYVKTARHPLNKGRLEEIRRTPVFFE